MKIRPLMKSRKAQLGLGTVKEVMITFLIISVIAVAIILALSSLKNSGIFTSGSEEYNQTANIISNVSTGTSGFFSNTGTIFSILVVVVIILAIAIIIAVVSRFGGGKTTTSL